MDANVNAVTRDQANRLMWAQVKPMLWMLAAGSLALFAGAIAFNILAVGTGWAVAAAAAASFCGFKTWQAETELALTAQRVQSNIDSNEFAREFSQAMYRSKTEGIDPVQALPQDLAQKVTYHQSLMPSPVAGRGDGQRWQSVVPKPETIQPRELMRQAEQSSGGVMTPR